jgi:hypothetical protein
MLGGRRLVLAACCRTSLYYRSLTSRCPGRDRQLWGRACTPNKLFRFRIAIVEHAAMSHGDNKRLIF